MTVRITTDELNPAALQEQIRDVGHGAVVVFEGAVRAEQREGRQLLALDYTAYSEMASEQLERIDRTVSEQYRCRVAIAHRLGKLAIGKIALIVAVSSPHRAEAFAACQDIVNAIKADVPIWKKEIWKSCCEK